jgi:DUF4097 and DUF4098 domain-containing protein YvlB
MSMMKRCIPLLAAVMLSATAHAQSVDRRLSADPSGELVVNNVAGSVRITGDEGSEVHVTGTLGENVERLDVETQGNDVVVRVVIRDNERNRGRSRDGDNDTDLLISAPRTMALEVSTVSASVDVREMRGEQRLATVSGDISTDAYGDALRVETVSGDVDVDSREGVMRARVSSVSGDLSLRGPAGDVLAESVSGDVEIAATTVGRAELRNVSGDLRLSAELAPDARLDATSTSGDIELELLGGGAGEYRLSTFSGDVYTCFGPGRADSGDRPRGVDVRFTEGNSSARITARTHSGDIDVCRR